MFSAIVVGCVAAYYFGLRTGAYAAAATFLLGLLGAAFPAYAFAIDLGIAAALVVIWWRGRGRPVPSDSALALRWARATARRWFDTLSR